MRCGGGQRALMVLFLLTVGCRAFIWKLCRIGKVLVSGLGTNLRIYQIRDEGVWQLQTGWKKQTQETDPSYYFDLEEQEVRRSKWIGGTLVLILNNGTLLADGACSWKWETGRRRDRRREAV